MGGNMKKALSILMAVLMLTALAGIPIGADEETEPAAPVSIELDLPRAELGLAEGTVTITLDPDSPEIELITLYWGDAESNPLDGYGLLARTRPKGYIVKRPGYSSHATQTNSSPTVVTLPTGLMIPEGAVSVLVRLENADGVSEYYPAPLPENTGTVSLGKPLISFQAVSDLHVNKDPAHECAAHVAMMLEDVAGTCPESAGIMVVGDIQDSGSDVEFERMLEMAEATENVPPLYYVIGNHDYGGGEPAEKIEQFNRYSGNDSLWFDKWIDGYHFIYLALATGECKLPFPAEEIAWLRETIAEDADPEKPIFLFCHESIEDTVAGSAREEKWWGIGGGDEIGAILAAYPQAIFFTGHSHWELASENEYYPADERMCSGFNTSSVGYLWTALDLVTGEYLMGSEGLYVTVYDNGVTAVRGRDFINRTWVAAAQYAVFGENYAPVEAETETESTAETENEPYLAPVIGQGPENEPPSMLPLVIGAAAVVVLLTAVIPGIIFAVVNKKKK